MWRQIFEAIGRALASVGSAAFAVADYVISFPFRLIALRNQQRQTASDAAAKAREFEQQNAAMRNALLNAPAASKNPAKDEQVKIDTLDKRADLIRLYAECVVGKKKLPNLDGLDMRLSLWCLSMRGDLKSAEVIKGLSRDALAGHINGRRPIDRLHPFPGEDRVKAAIAAYDRATKIIDECEEAAALKVA